SRSSTRAPASRARFTSHASPAASAPAASDSKSTRRVTSLWPSISWSPARSSSTGRKPAARLAYGTAQGPLGGGVKAAMVLGPRRSGDAEHAVEPGEDEHVPGPRRELREPQPVAPARQP